MTRLENRMRKNAVRKSHSPHRNSSWSRQVPFLKCLESKAKGEAPIRQEMESRPTISAATEKLMKIEIEDLLVDHKGSCTIVQLTNALQGSKRITNSHGGEESKLRSLITKVRNTMRPRTMKFNPASVAKRYQLNNAYSRIINANGAISTKVDSWARAREVLSREMDFDRDTGDLFDDVEQPHFLVAPYPYKMTPRRDEELENIPPSTEKYRQISAYQTPKKLAELTLEEKGAIEQELAIEQAKREEAERQREAELEAEMERQRLEKEIREREEEAERVASQLLRDFTEEEEDIVAHAMGPGNPNEVLAQQGGESITRASMQKLHPGEWVGDEAITMFLLTLAKRDEELCRADPTKKRSHFFNSFFMTKLLNEGHGSRDGVYEYKNVKRWSKKVPGKDIFNLDKIVVPINQGRMHWVCAVVFMQEKKIQFYDSLGSGGMMYLEALKRYIEDEHESKKGSPLPDSDEWELVTCTDDTPQQKNGYDCGVFLCTFADFVSMGYPLKFNQDHIHKCRQRIALSIMQGQAIV